MTGFSHRFAMGRRGWPTRLRASVVILAASLALTACTPKSTKAAQWESLADQQMDAGNYPAVVDSLTRALKYDSNDAGRWIKLARGERMQNHISLAAAAYLRAAELQPDNIEALQALAVISVRAGRYDQAKRYVDTLLVLAPDDVGATLAQGAIALFEERYDDADAAGDKLLRIAPSVSDGPILKARVLDARGHTREAAELLRRRMATTGDDLDVATQALMLFKKLGDRTGIQEAALVLARVQPNDPRYQLEAARAQRTRGDSAAAQATLDALAKRYSNNAQVMQAIAWQVREVAPAEAPDRIVALANAAGPHARAALSRMLTGMGEAKRALALTDAVAPLPVGPDTADMHGARATALLALGRAAEARAEAEKVLDFDGSDATALFVRARVARARHDYATALTDAQTILSGDASNSDAALLIAQLYAEQGSAALATKAFADAAATFPDEYRIHTERIAWLLAQNQAEVAAQIATDYARSHDRFTPAWVLAANACHRAGKNLCEAEARGHLGKG